MGRAFEYRKARKLKRWGNMSRTFTRLGKELTIAAKEGGTDPENNPRLRAIIQTARSENMPKENIERAIKRAEEKDKGDYREVVYEGFGPHGVAIIVETATDNTTRTVANIRSYFNKFGGNLGTSGSVDFMFDHISVFKVRADQVTDMETFELELIDYGGEEIFQDEEEGVIVVYGSFESYGSLQKFIEEKGLELVSGGFDRIVNGEMKQLTEEEKADVEKLLERIEEDDDVQNVYTNMA
ncbi:MAG TPA: YebC/PmpR family DNA-binding transcriptional regulator [Bacteroidales bacterium]|jgi:YebC/PmpR family DNA-binding regulatory protein|nr:YebC/PmpR family DNA-binding transcriptional regulator [Bacteroidales bacterium]MCZ2416426.1 YebC/PmpR family DNA-binding transcriptional regulator [Burkholderiales bacterium]OQC58126.1 MAG: putative transcriptional regulatory protein [Bacteroidetes bacterium ADurb.Bin013]MBP8999548.1 YebC/PmpR family DNA-binding transcriptional regulator [Bacteroidales bacterium]MBV6456352.1 putative transcriptional regulatory protein [Bacteroidales bacterium]